MLTSSSFQWVPAAITGAHQPPSAHRSSSQSTISIASRFSAPTRTRSTHDCVPLWRRRARSGNAAAIRGWLERFDELVRISSADNVDVVITHGEPHSGNIVRSGTHFALVDWDTVGLAPRERDLWLVGGGEPQLCELYRLRWRLDDLSSSVRVLLSPHDPDGDPERALRVLRISIEREPFTRD